MTIKVRISHENKGYDRQIHAVPVSAGTREQCGQGVYIDAGTWGELTIHSGQDVAITEVAPEPAADPGEPTS